MWNLEWDEAEPREIRKHGLDFGDAWEILQAIVPELDLRSDYGEDVGLSSGCLEIE